MTFNSTIRQKKGKCNYPGCGYDGPLTKGQCPSHYWSSLRMKSAAKADAREEEKEDTESVAILKKDADLIFSRLIRLRAAAPGTGLLSCYICSDVIHYSNSELMHYIGRADSSVRYDFKNCRPGCKKDNQYLDGNLKEYAERLEEEEKGLSERLYLEGNTVYKFSRDELKRMIADWTREINHLKKVKGLK